MLLEASTSQRIVSDRMRRDHETHETRMVRSLKKDVENAKEYNLDESGKPIIQIDKLDRFNNSEGISPHKLAATNSCNL